MPGIFHKVIRIDHRRAHLYDYTRESLRETAVIDAPDKPGNLHHRAGTPGPGHAAVDNAYFKMVADAVAGAGAILVVGPGDAESQFSHFVRDRIPEVAKRILGVEPHDWVGGGELHTFAGRFFAHADRMVKLKSG